MDKIRKELARPFSPSLFFLAIMIFCRLYVGLAGYHFKLQLEAAVTIYLHRFTNCKQINHCR